MNKPYKINLVSFQYPAALNRRTVMNTGKIIAEFETFNEAALFIRENKTLGPMVVGYKQKV